MPSYTDIIQLLADYKLDEDYDIDDADDFPAYFNEYVVGVTAW